MAISTNPSIPYDSRIEATNAFFRGVYRWMTVGLILTAVTAHGVASSPEMIGTLYGSPFLLIGLILVELGLVVALTRGIGSMSMGAAMGMFVVYSLLNGVTLSAVLLVYTGESVFSAFLTTAGMFGLMSVYGLYTRSNLSSWGSFLLMGLVGLIVATGVNIFVGSGTLDLAISAIGVFVFLGLTAYDTQYLRNLSNEVDVEGVDDSGRKLVILGALRLYLDFINLFLYLLRFMGKRR
ncbi:MAG: Bax inhibitor-1/YccA family protein [Synergistaceae bacterium]|jgi:FtsH-binding integral membrane protein|nr:Bax inhibitor-1/YccA family protein [Synergistaceae bacterium]